MMRRSVARLSIIALLGVLAATARAGSAPAPFKVLAATMTLNVSGADTHGASATITAQVPPHWGPPPHVHTREDEVYVVTKGHFQFVRGGTTMAAGPGSVVFFPKNVPHSFVNAGDTPGELVFTVIPAGLEKMFVEMSRRRLQEPRDLRAIVAIGKDYGITYLPPKQGAAAR